MDKAEAQRITDYLWQHDIESEIVKLDHGYAIEIVEITNEDRSYIETNTPYKITNAMGSSYIT